MDSLHMRPWLATPLVGIPSHQVRVPDDAGAPESMCSRTQNNDAQGDADIRSSYTCPCCLIRPRGAVSHQIRVHDDALLQSPRVRDARTRRSERKLTWTLLTCVYGTQYLSGVHIANR